MINVIGRIKLDGNQIFKIVLTFTLKKGASLRYIKKWEAFVPLTARDLTFQPVSIRREW